ncbi:endolytic transglycosylase MltG [Halomonas denitrificans]|nr:endolytic transglycosylase MltG [Halomonas denitrificans]
MRRFFLISLVLFLLVLGVAGGSLWHEYRSFVDRPLLESGTVRLWLPPGGHLGTAVGDLERLGLTRRDWRWRLLARQRSAPVAAGEYAIDSGTTPEGLIDRLAAGDVVRHRFTIIEGWTLDELRGSLGRDSRLSAEGRDLDDAALMTRLGCDGCPAEGRFLPETYFFVRGDSELDLLGRAHAALERALADAWRDRDESVPLDDPDELLVLASLVEKEAQVAAERAEVAGVFARRLRRGMRLQTDPTVVYGLGDDFDGRIRRVHLRTDHPWNTYTRHGLPPTPIALPGRAALAAAARPADGETLYFVARGDGTHKFSRTLAEHNRAVDRYIRGRE